MPEIYVSVHDGDFTAWLIVEDHAYPFDDVASALGALPDIEGGDHGYTDADDAFRETVWQEDVWWDRLPDARDGKSVAVALSGTGVLPQGGLPAITGGGR